MPEMPCGGSVFKFYHSSPLGHTFITHDRPGRRGEIGGDEIPESRNFF